MRAGISGGETPTATALLHAPAAEMAQRWGRYGDVDPVDDATSRVRIDASSPGWALFGLAMAGVPFEIEEASPSVREALADWAARFSAG
ncbi:WCX domain-containing protein [Calidifontibacter terrae]